MLWWTAWVPKKDCWGKWRCLVVLQRKGHTFHLLLPSYWPKPMMLLWPVSRSLNPSYLEVLPAKCEFQTRFESLSFLSKIFAPHKYHILFQKQQQSIKAKWAVINFSIKLIFIIIFYYYSIFLNYYYFLTSMTKLIKSQSFKHNRCRDKSKLLQNCLVVLKTLS